MALLSKGELAKYIYQQPKATKSWCLEDLVGHDRVRYFSYGRYALFEALKISGLKNGDRVLLPEFICRDLLSSINSIGVVPVFYPVDRSLQVAKPLDELPAAQAVIAVNYFGFPQNLKPFREYCNKAGAILIEDNAHGLFSRDEQGTLLGTRGDLGIFSLRKTIDMPNGAALLVNTSDNLFKLDPQLAPSSLNEPVAFKIKKALKRTVPWAGVAVIRNVTALTRFIRKVRTGKEIPASAPDAEWILPGEPEPCKGLFEYISGIDIQEEVWRRRYLYTEIDKILRDTVAEPVFDHLPEGTAPYLYPFYVDANSIKIVRNVLYKYGLEMFPWPELPDSLAALAPEYYKSVWGVNFI